MDRNDKRFHFVRLEGTVAAKAKKGKKPRKHYVYAAIPVEAGPNYSVNVNPKTGSVEFVNAVPGSVSSSYEYDRESGKPKHQFWGGNYSTVGHLAERPYIESNFDYLFAVDTNYQKFDGSVYAVASTWRLNGRVADYTGLANIQTSLVESLVFVNPKASNPETIGWHYFICHQLSSLGLPSASRIGLVVDSELGDLHEMNLRRKPYHRDLFLPTNIQLIYASDRAGDTLSGTLIKQCHSTASHILGQIKGGLIGQSAANGGCSDFDAGFRAEY